MNETTQSKQRIDDYRRRQSVSSRQYAIAKERRDAWALLLKGCGALSNAYNSSNQLPDDFRDIMYEMAKYGNEQYGKLIEYLSQKDEELADLTAKIRLLSEE